jgi:hypothetical protein
MLLEVLDKGDAGLKEIAEMHVFGK